MSRLDMALKRCFFPSDFSGMQRSFYDDPVRMKNRRVASTLSTSTSYQASNSPRIRKCRRTFTGDALFFLADLRLHRGIETLSISYFSIACINNTVRHLGISGFGLAERILFPTLLKSQKYHMFLAPEARSSRSAFKLRCAARSTAKFS